MQAVNGMAGAPITCLLRCARHRASTAPPHAGHFEKPFYTCPVFKNKTYSSLKTIRRSSAHSSHRRAYSADDRSARTQINLVRPLAHGTKGRKNCWIKRLSTCAVSNPPRVPRHPRLRSLFHEKIPEPRRPSRHPCFCQRLLSRAGAKRDYRHANKR